MSSRIARFDEAVRVEAVAWPTLPTVGTALLETRELEELRNALAASLEELRHARSRIVELDAARAEAEQAAHRKGMAEGSRVAQQAAEQQQAILLERISRAVADVAGLRARIRHEAETDLVKLSLAIARRITHRELNVNPEALLDVVRAALSKVPAGELTKVRLHPSMLETVKFQLENLKVPSAVEVEVDASLEPGDLLLETAGGFLDASIETQLREIERGFCDRFQD